MKSHYFYWYSMELEFTSNTAEGLLSQMKLLDWTQPQTRIDFKKEIGSNVLIFGERLIFWDAHSFLEALADAQLGCYAVTTKSKEVIEQ